MIQKNEFPILEYDFDSTEILKPNHGAEQLTLPEKGVFAFLGDTIDSYAAETGAAVAEHFETITKTYPIYVVKNDGEEFCLCQAPLGAPAAAQFMDCLIACYNGVGSEKLTASELYRCPNLSYNEDVLRERSIA